MIAIAVTVLFTVATLVAVTVSASSLRRAWSAYGELSRALARCETSQEVFVRMEAPEHPTPALRLVSSARRARLPVPCGLRAAA
ncbi:MAG: hypothetical protein PHE36_09925 [Novosphingobium sp.]|nr:hypothetical protein [Novosphingobium sp.]